MGAVGAHRLLAMTVLALFAAGWTSPESRVGPDVPQAGTGASQTGFAQSAVSATGTLIVFECTRRGNSRSDICAVRFDGSGTKLDPDGVFVSQQGSDNWDPSVTCSGQSCLVGWSAINDGVYVAGFDFVNGPATPQRVFDVQGTPDVAMHVAAQPGAGFMVIDSTYTELLSQTLSPTLVPLAPETHVYTSPGVMRVTTLTAGTTTMLACFQEVIGGGQKLRCFLLDLTGAPLTTAFDIAQLSPSRFSAEHAVAWNSGAYLVAYSDKGDSLRYRYVDELGTVGAESQVVPETNIVSAPGVSVDPTRHDTVIAWVENGFNVWLGRIEPAATSLAGPPEQVDTVSATEAITVSVAPSGLAVLTEGTVRLPIALLKTGLVIAFDDAGFTAVPSGPSDVQRGPDSDYFPRAAWTGSGWVMAWDVFGSEQATVWTRAATSDGTPTGVAQPVTDAGAFSWSPALAFAGGQAQLITSQDATTLQLFSLDAAGARLAGPTALQPLDETAFTSATALGAVVHADWTAPDFGNAWFDHDATVPADGGAFVVDAVAPFALPAQSTWLATAASDTQVFSATGTGSGLFWPGANPSLNPVVRVEAASDGQDFVVVWNEGFYTDTVFAVRVAADGGVLDAIPVVIMAENFHNAEVTARPAVAFDGQAYRIAWEVDDDAGVDIWWRRMWPDGSLDAPSILVGTPEIEEQVSLTAGGPGRILVQWRQYEPAALTMRVHQMVWAEIGDGGVCTVNEECLNGQCGGGTCGGDAGVPPAFDGGPALTDGGPSTAPDGGTLERHLDVGCGCDSAHATPLLVALLLAGRRRRST